MRWFINRQIKNKKSFTKNIFDKLAKISQQLNISASQLRMLMTPWKSKNPQTGRINKPNVPGRTNKKMRKVAIAISRALECRPMFSNRGSVQAEQNPKQNN